MKTTSFLSSLLIALVLVFSACKKDEETKPDTEQEEEKNNEEEENTEQEGNTEEEENTEEETEEENNETASIVGSWHTNDSDFCDNNTNGETYVLNADLSGSLYCEGVGDLTYTYTLSSDKKTLTLDLDIFGEVDFNIVELTETTLKTTVNGSTINFTRVTEEKVLVAEK